MKPYKIFIDGSYGTTGLRIEQRLSQRKDIELLKIDAAFRKDENERKRLLNSADISFLCLPDAAAVQAVSMIENGSVKVIDASTAHRTNDSWTYGFPELSTAHRSAIKVSKRVCVPGCHASGFASVVYPLVEAGIIPKDYPLCATSVTGYSGGGNGMISSYTAEDRPSGYDSPRQYALSQNHKHQPEMKKINGLVFTPVINPIVSDFYAGMVVSVPLYTRLLPKSTGVEQIKEIYNKKYYDSKIVRVVDRDPDDGFLDASALAGKDFMEIYVFGNEERILIASRFDNLGKGASGAAVQCMNLMLGIDEKEGLVL